MDWHQVSWLLQGNGWVDAPIHHNSRQLLQTQTVAGVGPGVFILIFFGVVFGVTSFAFSKTKLAGVVYAASAGAYGIILLALLVTPRGEDDSIQIVDVKDYSILWLVVLAIFMVLAVFVALAGIMIFVVAMPVKARKLNEYQDILRIH